jgi:pyruvate/2-oxoglutarate dehydrogenase complex dihydrolipoamide acyltransferase (E2) component
MELIELAFALVIIISILRGIYIVYSVAWTTESVISDIAGEDVGCVVLTILVAMFVGMFVINHALETRSIKATKVATATAARVASKATEAASEAVRVATAAGQDAAKKSTDISTVSRIYPDGRVGRVDRLRATEKTVVARRKRSSTNPQTVSPPKSQPKSQTAPPPNTWNRNRL